MLKKFLIAYYFMTSLSTSSEGVAELESSIETSVRPSWNYSHRSGHTMRPRLSQTHRRTCCWKSALVPSPAGQSHLWGCRRFADEDWEQAGWLHNGSSCAAFREINFFENFHCTFEISLRSHFLSLKGTLSPQSNKVHLIGAVAQLHLPLISCPTLSKSHHLSEH